MNNQKIEIYSNAQDHLMDEMQWVNCVIHEFFGRLKSADQLQRFQEFSGLAISTGEIEAIINNKSFLSRLDRQRRKSPGNNSFFTSKQVSSAKIRQTIDAKVKRSVAADCHLPLAELCSWFALTDFQYHTFLLCLIPQLDPRYQKIYAYLQDNISKTYPSRELILDLLCKHSEERLSRITEFEQEATLRRFMLIEVAKSSTIGEFDQQHYCTSSRLVSHVLGESGKEQRVSQLLHLYRPCSWDEVVLDEENRNALKHIFNQLLENGGESEIPAIIHLRGARGVGKKTVARALCGQLGLPIAVTRLTDLLTVPEKFRENVRLMIRESRLLPCAIFIDGIDSVPNTIDNKETALELLIGEISEMGWLTFLGSREDLHDISTTLENLISIELPRPDFVQQLRLWQIYLNDLKEGFSLPSPTELANRFSLNGAQISRAVRQTRLDSLLIPEGQKTEWQELLIKNCRLQSQPKLSNYAQKIRPNHNWDRLILPPEQIVQLRDLTAQVQNSNKVMEEWGFATRLSLGQGLSALFAGPSGTGKTMAAEVIANDLGLDLFKIDLSAVVSKYIGETEKNLNSIFDEAENSNVILFFDEADAILGKRSEVKDAHDRYSNIEIAYLLQKMEEYNGITILATNLKQNIDDAFTRRIRFVIEFPFPSRQFRQMIWRGIWPGTRSEDAPINSSVPLADDIDFQFLADHFELAGGNIRNIALTASFYAADNGNLVNMQHLIRATRRELQKMGKVLVKEDFREYQNLIA